MHKSKLLSIVIPIFNEEENIEKLHSRISDIASILKYFSDFEIVTVNDGSKDNSLEILKNIASKDNRIKIVSFTRNFGHEAATTAGIFHANGDAVAIVDADLQDPPELLFEFEKELKNGFDIIYGQRTKRLNETIFKKLTSKLFYPIFRWLTKVDIPKDTGDFCMLSRKAVDSFKQLSEKSLFVRGMIYWSGLPKKAVKFVRPERDGGKTKYNYWKLTKFAIDNIISFSIVPIYLIIALSLITILFCIVGTIVALVFRFNGWVIMSGWTSLLISMLFLSSSIIFVLGIIGLYIGKIYEEVKNRPRYVVDELINFDPSIHRLRRHSG